MIKEYTNGPHKLTLDLTDNIALVFTKGDESSESHWNDYLEIFTGGVTGQKIFGAITADGGDMAQLYNEISVDLLKMKR